MATSKRSNKPKFRASATPQAQVTESGDDYILITLDDGEYFTLTITQALAVRDILIKEIE